MSIAHMPAHQRCDARPSVEAIISPAKKNSITDFRFSRTLVIMRGRYLLHHHRYAVSTFARPRVKALTHLFVGNSARQIERIENDRRRNADHDQHDFGQFVDAERYKL